MSQPPPYARRFNFTDWQQSNPSSPLPGTAADNEFNAVLATLVGVLRNLAAIQRDDGKLINGLVTLETLSPAVMVALGAGAIWLPRGAWVTGAAYALSDVVYVGTATYVCALAHTAGTFATDASSGRWVKLYDDAGAIPADGSVTEPKLADNSVSTRAIGFTALDLAGSIRGQGGIQAGSAPTGALMHAKADAGDAIGKVERKTKAQGVVGYQVIGVGVTWQVASQADSDDLGVGIAGTAAKFIWRKSGLVDQAGHLRVTGSTTPSTGEGVALSYSTQIGFLDAYDFDAAAWRNLKVRGAEVYVSAGGVDIIKTTSSGTDTNGFVRRSGIDLGYLDLPQNPQSGGYTLALSDRGKHVFSSNSAGQTITIPINSAVAFPTGTAIAIINAGTGAITIVAPPGGALKLAGPGTTGNRTLAANGIATLIKTAADDWWISGAGIS